VPALTADQLEDAARAAEDEAEQHERKAVALREHARLLREAMGTAPKGLTIGRNRSMVDSNMEASDLAGQPENVRTSANRARRSPELRKLLAQAGLTDSGVAQLIGVKRPTANAYVTGRLSIPRRLAEKIALKHPTVTVESWPKLGE
jgi:hypothetical protein